MRIKCLYIIIAIIGALVQEENSARVNHNQQMLVKYYDSYLKDLSIPELRTVYDRDKSSLELKQLITKAYLNKAKINKDSFEIARAFDLAARLYDTETNLKYCDSIILYSQNCADYSYPALGYMLKGYYYYEIGAYEKSLKSYYEAYDLAQRFQNKNQEIEISQVLGAFQNRWGNYKKAIEIYENHIRYLKSLPDFESLYLEDYLITIHNLQLAYQRAGNYKQAEKLIETGLRKTLRTQDRAFFYDFLHSKGVNAYYLGQYLSAQQLLKEALPELTEDLPVVSISYFYLAQIAKRNADEPLAHSYFERIDSIYTLNREVYPELKTVYHFLIDYSKKESNPNQEIYFTRRALEVDSVINSNKLFLNESYLDNVVKPNLAKELQARRQALTIEYQKKIWIYSLALLGALLIGFFLKRKLKKGSYFSVTSSGFFNYSGNEIQESSEPILTEEIKTVLLRKLQGFENQEHFLDPELSLFGLAKDLNTNSAYLSRVINEIKGLNFSNYINELRVEYLVKKLADDPRLQYYKIQALGEEGGFKKAYSFSKAFEKKIGIKPSTYLRQLRAVNT